MPTTPEDNALLAQFAGQAMQALFDSDAGHSPAEISMIATEAYDMAEAMLQEHKRRTAAVPEPVSTAEPSIPLSVAQEVIQRALEFQKDPQTLATAERFAGQLIDAMRRASSDGQERGNG